MKRTRSLAVDRASFLPVEADSLKKSRKKTSFPQDSANEEVPLIKKRKRKSHRGLDLRLAEFNQITSDPDFIPYSVISETRKEKVQQNKKFIVKSENTSKVVTASIFDEIAQKRVSKYADVSDSMPFIIDVSTVNDREVIRVDLWDKVQCDSGYRLKKANFFIFDPKESQSPQADGRIESSDTLMHPNLQKYGFEYVLDKKERIFTALEVEKSCLESLCYSVDAWISSGDVPLFLAPTDTEFKIVVQKNRSPIYETTQKERVEFTFASPGKQSDLLLHYELIKVDPANGKEKILSSLVVPLAEGESQVAFMKRKQLFLSGSVQQSVISPGVIESMNEEYSPSMNKYLLFILELSFQFPRKYGKMLHSTLMCYEGNHDALISCLRLEDASNTALSTAMLDFLSLMEEPAVSPAYLALIKADIRNKNGSVDQDFWIAANSAILKCTTEKVRNRIAHAILECSDILPIGPTLDFLEKRKDICSLVSVSSILSNFELRKTSVKDMKRLMNLINNNLSEEIHTSFYEYVSLAAYRNITQPLDDSWISIVDKVPVAFALRASVLVTYIQQLDDRGVESFIHSQAMHHEALDTSSKARLLSICADYIPKNLLDPLLFGLINNEWHPNVARCLFGNGLWNMLSSDQFSTSVFLSNLVKIHRSESNENRRAAALTSSYIFCISATYESVMSAVIRSFLTFNETEHIRGYLNDVEICCFVIFSRENAFIEEARHLVTHARILLDKLDSINQSDIYESILCFSKMITEPMTIFGMELIKLMGFLFKQAGYDTLSEECYASNMVYCDYISGKALNKEFLQKRRLPTNISILLRKGDNQPPFTFNFLNSDHSNIEDTIRNIEKAQKYYQLKGDKIVFSSSKASVVPIESNTFLNTITGQIITCTEQFPLSSIYFVVSISEEVSSTEITAKLSKLSMLCKYTDDVDFLRENLAPKRKTTLAEQLRDRKDELSDEICKFYKLATEAALRHWPGSADVVGLLAKFKDLLIPQSRLK